MQSHPFTTVFFIATLFSDNFLWGIGPTLNFAKFKFAQQYRIECSSV